MRQFEQKREMPSGAGDTEKRDREKEQRELGAEKRESLNVGKWDSLSIGSLGEADKVP